MVLGFPANLLGISSGKGTRRHSSKNGIQSQSVCIGKGPGSNKLPTLRPSFLSRQVEPVKSQLAHCRWSWPCWIYRERSSEGWWPHAYSSWPYRSGVPCHLLLTAAETTHLIPLDALEAAALAVPSRGATQTWRVVHRDCLSCEVLGASTPVQRPETQPCLCNSWPCRDIIVVLLDFHPATWRSGPCYL